MNHYWIFFEDTSVAHLFTSINGGTVHTDDGVYANGQYTGDQCEQAFELGAYHIMPVIPVEDVAPVIVKYNPVKHVTITVVLVDG